MNIAKFLTERGVEFQLLPHRDTYSAQRMAQALHVRGREVAKTVLLRANHGFEYVIAVLPATMSIDFQRLSKGLNGAEVALATEVEIAERCPDCEIGVLPPFGSQYGVKTIVEKSLAEDEEIVFEGNTHHEAIRMKFRDYHDIEEPLILAFASERKPVMS